MTTAPTRLTVPTCIGCGAMGEPGTCERGCRERKLELVRGAAHDALAQARVDAVACAEAFGPVLERLAVGQPAAGEHEAAYRSLQAAARAALRDHPDPHGERFDEPTEPATTWWCERCGAIDAPQPCLGICIWRPVEWVTSEAYENERALALGAFDRERRLRQLTRRAASITPRAGYWRVSWNALRDEARRTLATSIERTAATTPG